MNPNLKKMLAARAQTNATVAKREQEARELAAYRASPEGQRAEADYRAFQQEVLAEALFDLNRL